MNQLITWILTAALREATDDFNNYVKLYDSLNIETKELLNFYYWADKGKSVNELPKTENEKWNQIYFFFKNLDWYFETANEYVDLEIELDD